MFAVQPVLGHIPADTVGPPAILNVSAVVKNKPFQNTSALRRLLSLINTVDKLQSKVFIRQWHPVARYLIPKEAFKE
jgi:hypothetical protein